MRRIIAPGLAQDADSDTRLAAGKHSPAAGKAKGRRAKRGSARTRMPPVQTSSSRARVARHLAAAAACVALAIAWTFPLVRHLSTHIPGSEAGDNVTFLWNFWWMRQALAASSDVFRTTSLFVPTGSDLTLHTHTALPAFVGATLLARLSVPSALNVTIVAALALNAFFGYLLGWRVTRDHAAGMLAGIIAGGSPFVSAHLHGHFNLIHVWTIAAFAIAAHGAIVERSTRSAVAAGLVLGLTAYVDYYYVVFEAMLAFVLAASEARDWSLSFHRGSGSRRRWASIVAALLVIVAAAITAIFFTGGFAIPIGSIRLTMRSAFNPLQAFWLLMAVWLWLRLAPAFAAPPSPHFDARAMARALAIVAAVFVVTAAPIIWKAIAAIAHGDYVTQRHFWRSGPRGIDVATLVLGNPFNAAFGLRLQAWYRSIGIDVLEATAWLGLVPLALAVLGIARGWRSPDIRRWTAVIAVFFVWALGPHLMALGFNTGMILPQALLRYLPIVSNARIPGRALAVVFLALAVLCACAVAEWRRRTALPGWPLAALALAVVVDFLPAPFPLTALERPAIYETLRARPETGALCELPLGMRDGFAERGHLDERVLFFQTLHGRPITGGFAARLSPSVLAMYDGDPLLSTLLRLSGPPSTVDAALPDRQLAGLLLRKHGIGFVMLNRATAPAALIEYVGMLPLRLIAEERERSLYVVETH
jgi:hypothetical protein